MSVILSVSFFHYIMTLITSVDAPLFSCHGSCVWKRPRMLLVHRHVWSIVGLARQTSFMRRASISPPIYTYNEGYLLLRCTAYFQSSPGLSPAFWLAVRLQVFQLPVTIFKACYPLGRAGQVSRTSTYITPQITGCFTAPFHLIKYYKLFCP